MEGSVSSQSEYHSWIDFENDAIEAFLRVTSRGIKEIAGHHMESLEVHRDGFVSWLEYHGQNSSDVDFTWCGFITPKYIAGNSVVFTVSVKMVGLASHTDRSELPAGLATPRVLVNSFAQVFHKGVIEPTKE